MPSLVDIKAAVIQKIAQWSGLSQHKIAERMTDDEVLDRTVFVGNATARMQVPVHPHGHWISGNVGYDPNQDVLLAQTYKDGLVNIGGASVLNQDETIIAAPGAGSRLVIKNIILTGPTTANAQVTFKGSGTNIVLQTTTANTPMFISFGNHGYQCSTNTAFTVAINQTNESIRCFACGYSTTESLL